MDARAPKHWGQRPENSPDYTTLESAVQASIAEAGARTEPTSQEAPAPLAPPRSGPPTDAHLLNSLVNAQWGRRRWPSGPIIKGNAEEGGNDIFRPTAPQRLTVSLKPSANPSVRTGTSPIFRADPGPVTRGE